jgi:N-acetyl-gamma-glutamyl-phosphate/LysW-gamma-L-alpha-aminoadipyl-6-phosphate reductase
MRNAAVLGAGGYVGGELLRLIVGHPHLQLAAAVSDSQAGQSVAEVHPELASWTDLRFISHEEWPGDELRQGSWIVFAALDHGSSAARLSALLDDTTGCDLQLVDLSGDFRLDDPVVYKRYYGAEHAAPDRLDAFVYGLPELNRSAIQEARLVANPGCFATAATLALLPAAAAAWQVTGVAVTGMTGSSGAGAARGPPGMPLSFVPHRTPLVRGIVVSAQLFLEEAVEAEAVADQYRSFYQDAPFVRFLPRPPAAVEVWGSNRCDMSVTVHDRMLAVSTAIDNLVKGAAGQAVQNANLMNGWDETTGLLTPMPRPV